MVFRIDLITYNGTGEPDYDIYTTKYIHGPPIPITWLPGVNDEQGNEIVHTVAHFGTLPYLAGMSSLEFDPAALSGHLSFWKLENDKIGEMSRDDLFYKIYTTLQTRMNRIGPRELGFRKINLSQPYYPFMKTSLTTTLAMRWDDHKIFPFIANISYLPNFVQGNDAIH